MKTFLICTNFSRSCYRTIKARLSDPWKDGNGLNALLQNYWMVIHPPVLFLGFASTIIPFAYAIAGLWKKDHKGWTKPAIPWAAFLQVF
jgi:cytochrome c biogenesis factor